MQRIRWIAIERRSARFKPWAKEEAMGIKIEVERKASFERLMQFAADQQQVQRAMSRGRTEHVQRQ
jgi:hypothetical protein